MITIRKTGAAVEREPLMAPFGFKGGYVDELWQSIAMLEDELGNRGVGLGVQSILWSDPDLFGLCGSERGNQMMHQITTHALTTMEQTSFESPLDLLEQLVPSTYDYGRGLTGLEQLRLTFALNALVSVDHAAWQLYGRRHGKRDFLELVPQPYRSPLTHRHERLASAPVVAYGTPEEEIRALLDSGYFVLKIKLGADPDKDGDQEKMLAFDTQRMADIHRIAKAYTTAHTDNGRIAYYLDANGRYGDKTLVLRFLEEADRIGALEHVLLLEEPFPDHVKEDVHDIPVRVVGDESVHDEHDALEKIELGYGAFALKPIAKTMSMSLKVARLAHENGIPCFCADLTVNPMMVDWNKQLAARLAPIPGLSVGLIESNGPQNYSNWDGLLRRHPAYGADWIETRNGLFELSSGFYTSAIEGSAYYESLFA